jgi:hypothetical protein
LSASAISTFVLRYRSTFVPDSEVLSPRRVSCLAAILDADVRPARTDEETRWILDRRARDLGLDPAIYKDLLHLPDGGVSTLASQWLSAEPSATLPGPRRAGYDVLQFVPDGSTLITTNQDRLASTLAPHLNVTALNGEVSHVFVDARTRSWAIDTFANSTCWVLPEPFVILGTPQPTVLTDRDDFSKVWSLTASATAVIVVGYRFANGLDGGSWHEFRRQMGRVDLPVHVVDPDAQHVARDVAYGLHHRAPVGHPLAWNRVSYALLHLMERFGFTHPRALLPRVREVIRVHDELSSVLPQDWASTLASWCTRMRPKSLRL